ncbi:MAG TPA: NAD-dependent succinate-semialdehyde dehydrogenase [Microlunatus sp.]|nr:NAD-dependent succinate-semialdehyde dehydrogenase [Microlunatus sp.]
MSTYAVIDPATGIEVQSFPTAGEAEVEAAVAAAAQAYATWSRQTSVADRAQLVRRVGELHTERREELADIIGREMGKAKSAALGEVDFCREIHDYYADHAEKLLADQPVELQGSGTAVIRRSAFGVLLGIMPWNYPYYQVARFAAPNLVTGNPIILKHAPQCPESAAALQAMYADAGFPDGAYVNLYASNDQVATIIADPRVAGVSLTGSERAGAAVAEIAGRHLKKVVLELGGSDPFVLLSADDLGAAVDAAVEARLENTGQACNAAKRFIVAEGVYDDFVAGFTERMLAGSADLSPLSSVAAAETLAKQVDQAVSEGADLASKGERQGAYFPPGVLTGVTPENSVFRQELFGPVAMVFKAADEDEAIALANDTPFGLGSYVFSADADQAARVADRLDAGMVFINGVGLEAAELPFGGVKRSGFGRELGTLGIEEFVNKKMIRTAG